jgi:hypothetical protein
MKTTKGILNKNAMQQIVGGDGDLMALIDQMWRETPRNGKSTWTNEDGDDCWEGIIQCSLCDTVIQGTACI